MVHGNYCVIRAVFFSPGHIFFPCPQVLITIIIIVVFLAYELVAGDLLLSPDLDKTPKECMQLLICVFCSYVDDHTICITSNRCIPTKNTPC